MEKMISREAALALLRQYNQEPFHIQHALTVEAVMRWFANDLGYGKEADFWAMCGLLHDIDFEKWPEQHCVKAPELLRPAGVGEEMIHAICSHGHKICTDVVPEKEMEKVLFACDELTGLIGAAALMRPSKSTTDMELSSVKKKFKDKKFAAGCSREVIKDGAELLGWELDELLTRTLDAMKSLPEELRTVMKPCTKYTDNTGNSMEAAAVTATQEWLFLLSEWEYYGARTMANEGEQSFQQQYAYYAAGGSPAKMRHNRTTATARDWCRSPAAGWAGFCHVNKDGTAYYEAPNADLGIAPAFVLGA